jgi:DNA-binding XRE family transcriptional regulator
MKVNSLSAAGVATQAGHLYKHWQTMHPEEKRELIELIVEKIVIGKEEITINLCYSPSSKEMANRWRKGSVLNPFCHLVIRAIRWDSPPLGDNKGRLQKALLDARSRLNMNRGEFALKIGVSDSTIKNWERGRTKPARQFWKLVCHFARSRNGFNPVGVSVY